MSVANDEMLPNISNITMETLIGDMKKMGEDLGAFRYYMFSKRLVAATYGRQDAVIWANDWYCDLYDEAKVAMTNEFTRRRKLRLERLISRNQFLAGKVGNPRYQLYLDTVENPASIKNNVDYFAWCSGNEAEYRRIYSKTYIANLDDAKDHFHQFEKSRSNEQLSERVKRSRSS